MPVPRRSLHGEWSSSGMFVLAVAGAGIGFGTYWRFPGLVAEHGGEFLVLYILALLLLGFPLLLAEMLIGRGARQAPIQAFAALARLHGLPRLSRLAGVVMLLAALVLLAGLCVLAGWSMGFAFRAAGTAGSAMEPAMAARLLRGLTGDPERSLAWQTLFMAVVAVVVLRGPRRGMEPFLKLALPVMLLALLALLLYVQQVAPEPLDWPRQLEFGVSPPDPRAVMAALRHAFLGLALGIGVAVTCAAYLNDRASLPLLAGGVVGLSAVVSIAAAVVVLGLVGSGALVGANGPELLFQTLPVALSTLPHGHLATLGMFVLLVLAALTTAVALLDVLVASLVERGGLSRSTATALAAGTAWVLALAAMLSFSVWSGWYPLAAVPGLATATVFDLLGRLLTLILLPLATFAVVVFTGWMLPRETLAHVFGWREGRAFATGLWFFRICLPLLLLLVLLDGLGLSGKH